MIRDSAVFIIMIFAIAISIMVAFLAFNNVSDAFQDADIDQTHKDFIKQQSLDFPRVWDFTFMSVLVAVVIGVLVLSWVLRSQPALFFALLMVVVVLTGISGFLSNAFDDIISESIFTNVAANFPIMNWIMSNYMIVSVIMMSMMLIVFFAKPSGGAGI